jgi:lipooligosaccharide transport system permease protein
MAFTSFMRSWQDFDFVQLAILPLFLFSTTFYPLSVYPRWLQLVVECTPLFHGVTLVRSLTTGFVGFRLLWDAAYLAIMGLTGLVLTSRRLQHLLLT